jgi:hypothetical protein
MPTRNHRAHWRGWQSSGDQVGNQGSQLGGVDGLAGRGQFGLDPPTVAVVVLTLELVQPCRISQWRG